MSSVIEELPKFQRFFSVLSHNFATNGWNLIKLILNIYDHCVVMHVKFYQGILNIYDHGVVMHGGGGVTSVSSVIEEILPFDCLNFNNFSRPQP